MPRPVTLAVVERETGSTGIERELEGRIAEDLRSRRSVILLGPRRSGKTTVLRRISEEAGARVRPVFYDCRVASTVEDLYHGLCRAALRSWASVQREREYALIAQLAGWSVEFVRASRDHHNGRIDQVALVKHLYNFKERIEEWPGDSEILGGVLADVVGLRVADDREGLMELQRLIRTVAGRPPEHLPEALLGTRSRLSELLLPWLRYNSGVGSGLELPRSLLAALEHGCPSGDSPLLLIDEIQSLADPEFSGFFAALRTTSLSYVICADGLAGELLTMVREIGPAKRHPFVEMDAGRRIVVRHAGPLEPSEGDRLAGALLDRAGMAAAADAVSAVHEAVGGLPGYLESLVGRCVDLARGAGDDRLTPAVVELALDRLIRDNDADFAAILEGIPRPQRAVLLRLASDPDATVSLEGQSTAALDGLAQRFLVERISADRWRLSDPVFATWLRRLGR
jgi:hypothetical protein